MILTGSFPFSFTEKNCVISISFRAGAQSHKVVNFGIQAEFKIQENFNVNKLKKYIMNKILILYETLASWCLSICKKGNLRCVYCTAPYLSSALSVVLCLGSVQMGQLWWKSSSFGQGCIETTSFQRKDPTSMCKCQFVVSGLGEEQWLLAKDNLLFVFSCVLTDTRGQKMELRLRSFWKQVKLLWSS